MKKELESVFYQHPLSSWEIGDGDFTALSCGDCARKFAQENRFEEITSVYFQDQKNEYGYASECYGCGHETDYPQTCSCGEYLRTNLTPDGVEYLKENDFPIWLVEFYLGKGVAN